MEISKELFIAVRGSFNKEIFELILKGNSIEINSFFFECKEWAFSKGYLLSSFKRFNELNYGCVIDTQYSNECPECGESYGIHFILGITEQDSVITACEWILKELNEKQLQH